MDKFFVLSVGDNVNICRTLMIEKYHPDIHCFLIHTSVDSRLKTHRFLIPANLHIFNVPPPKPYYPQHKLVFIFETEDVAYTKTDDDKIIAKKGDNTWIASEDFKSEGIVRKYKKKNGTHIGPEIIYIEPEFHGPLPAEKFITTAVPAWTVGGEILRIYHLFKNDDGDSKVVYTDSVSISEDRNFPVCINGANVFAVVDVGLFEEILIWVDVTLLKIVHNG